MKALHPEQVLIIADEVCAFTGAKVVNYAALCCCAALSNPSFQGIPVFQSSTERQQAIQALIHTQPPLSSHNQLFAATLQEVLVSRETKGNSNP